MQTKKFLTNIIKYCIPSVVTAFLSIAVIPIISRVFPADDYGKINMFYSVGNMILYISMLGLDSAYIRFYFEDFNGVKKKEIFSLTIWLSLLFIFISTLIVLFTAKDIVTTYLFGETKSYLLIFLSIYVFSLVVFRMLSIETRMEEKSLLYNIQQIILVVINRVSYVVAALITTSYEFAIIIITLSTLFFAIIFVLKQKRISDFKVSVLPGDTFKKLMAFSIPLMPTTVMIWLNNAGAKMVLSGYGDFNAVGILSMATGLANVFSLIPSAFCIYWSPFMYKNYETEQLFIRKVHNYILLISVVIVLLFYNFQDIIYIIIGNEYKESQPFFMLIMLAAIQSLICETTSYGIIIAKKTKINMYISIIACMINMFTGYFLYPIIGVYGVVVGIALAALFQLVIKTIMGQKYYVSIMKKWQTIIIYCVIFVVTLSNTMLYNEVILRIIVSGVILILVVFTFKDDLLAVLNIVHTKKLRWKDKE